MPPERDFSDDLESADASPPPSEYKARLCYRLRHQFPHESASEVLPRCCLLLTYSGGTQAMSALPCSLPPGGKHPHHAAGCLWQPHAGHRGSFQATRAHVGAVRAVGVLPRRRLRGQQGGLAPVYPCRGPFPWPCS